MSNCCRAQITGACWPARRPLRPENSAASFLPSCPGFAAAPCRGVAVVRPRWQVDYDLLPATGGRSVAPLPGQARGLAPKQVATAAKAVYGAEECLSIIPSDTTALAVVTH